MEPQRQFQELQDDLDKVTQELKNQYAFIALLRHENNLTGVQSAQQYLTELHQKQYILREQIRQIWY